MPFPSIIDIESLVQPIAGDSPCGEDIRDDRSPTSDYYSIKDARNNARAAERSSMFDEDVDLITPWRAVQEIAPKILKDKSKDLEVAAWYTEALIRLHGVTGLRDGLGLIEALIEQHWDNLYPQPDEDGLETKVAPITGLNGDGGDGTLMAPIRNAAITDEGDLGSFNLWQYQKARDNDKIADPDEKSGRIESLGFSLQDIESTVAATPTDFYVDLIDTLQQAIDSYKNFSGQLKSYCGNEAPPSSNISQLMDEVLRSVRFLSKEKLEALEAQNAAATEAPSLETATTETSDLIQQVIQGPAVATGAIVNREDALRRLQDVADYFRTHEPHTPIAPGIERLIEWGRMTVSELMMALLPEDHSRNAFSQLTGVKLDGSDDQKYVAPAAPTPVNNSSASNVPTTPKPTAEAPAPEPEQATGW